MTVGVGETLLGETAAESRRARGSVVLCAWILAMVAAGMTAAGLALVAAGATSWQRFLTDGHPDSAVVGLVGGFVSALIIAYRPRNPVGWLLVVNAAGHGLRTLTAEYAAYALVHQHGSLPSSRRKFGWSIKTFKYENISSSDFA